MAGAYDDRDGWIWMDGAFVPWREALGGTNAAEEFQLLRVWNGVGLNGIRKHFNSGLRLQCLLVDMDGYGALSW